MVLSSAIRLDLLLEVISRLMEDTVIILLLQLLPIFLFTLYLLLFYLCISKSLNWCKNDFFPGGLHEEVCMHPPLGIEVHNGQACHPRKALYGLKQAPHVWFQQFDFVVQAAGFSCRETTLHFSLIHLIMVVPCFLPLWMICWLLDMIKSILLLLRKSRVGNIKCQIWVLSIIF